MERYDEKCPICGELNKGLYLKETEGWFICERCKNKVQLLKYSQKVKIPVLTTQQLAALANK